MDAVATLALVSYPILLGILAWFMKRWVDRLERAIDRFEISIKEILKTQSECQISLNKTYRTKADADQDSTRQWEKLDDLSNRMTRVETKIGG